MKFTSIVFYYCVYCFNINNIIQVKSQNEVGFPAEVPAPPPKVTFAQVSAVLNNGERRCWIRSYGRGAGLIPNECPYGFEKGLEGLCYPICKDGYSGFRDYCSQNCPKGFSSFGGSCAKPSSYGRGTGYAIWNKQKCERENPIGCEQYGLMHYPKCKKNFHNFGCCICSPNCPYNMRDDGAFCSKHTYHRGNGLDIKCNGNYEKSGLFCYKPCEKKYNGLGSVCWGVCPKGFNKCGAVCLENTECWQYLVDYLAPVAEFMVSVAMSNYVGAAIAAAQIIVKLIQPLCDKDEDD